MTLEMKPILFGAPMVQALLNTKPGVWPAEPIDESKPFKSQTRRVMKPQPTLEKGEPGFWNWKDCQWADGGLGFPESGITDHSPCKPGDILYVREPWADIPETAPGNLHYRASATDGDLDWFRENNWKWKPSIHMPREAARLFLEVKSVSVERLRNITEADAKAEGVGIEWLENWVKENYWEPDSAPHWICDGYNGHDQSESYCHKCGSKEIKKRKLLAKREGAPEEEIEAIHLDGGWTQEDDIFPCCETCGKPLAVDATDTLMNSEIEHYLKYGASKKNAYLMDQFLEMGIEDNENFHRLCFATLWDELSAKRGHSWESNHWVWVYEFGRVEG